MPRNEAKEIGFLEYKCERKKGRNKHLKFLKTGRVEGGPSLREPKC